MRIAIEPANLTQIDRLAAIHADSLPGDFLPSLGRDFLASQYYRAALASVNGLTLVATEGAMPVGFATVAFDSGAFSRDVLRGRLWSIAGYALRRSLRQPGHLLLSTQVLFAALRPRPFPCSGEIVFIAVAAQFRGRGIGLQLIQSAQNYLAQHSVYRCRTKTLASNVKVIRLYTGLGWQVVDRYPLIGSDYVVLLSPESGVSNGA